MKRRCVPLRGDHNLLTPDTHTLSGVRLHPVVQVRLEGVASHSGHLSDSSISKSAVGVIGRGHEDSPTRRLRFEDETETEVEYRYLERQRQRRWMGQRGTGVLVSKPHLNVYINSKEEAGLQGSGSDSDIQRTESRQTTEGLNLPGGKGRILPRPYISLRTEPIKETYIGSVPPGENKHPNRGSGAGCVSNTKMRTSINKVELNKNQGQRTIDLPMNPYAPDLLTSRSCPRPLLLPSVMSQRIRLNGTTTRPALKQDQEEQGAPAGAKPHRQLQAEVRTTSPSVEEMQGVADRKTDSDASSSCSEGSSDTTAASGAPPISESSSDKQVKDPIGGDRHSHHTSPPEHFSSRDESSRLSLRRLFSTFRLNRTGRTGSLDRLSNRLHSSSSDPAPSGLLRKCPSVQSLNEGPSSFFQLRKLSSLQSFGSEQMKKKDHYDRFLQRSLSVEDVGCPRSVRPVGRVLEAGSDGTVLLELNQPITTTFILSRGRGRLDSGVYVEDMVDGSSEKLCAGLLSVGDEVLEVNGEKVACLSLDQVTNLLTQNVSATVRVLRHLRMFPQ